jgi:hypothetical protein
MGSTNIGKRYIDLLIEPRARSTPGPANYDVGTSLEHLGISCVKTDGGFSFAGRPNVGVLPAPFNSLSAPDLGMSVVRTEKSADYSKTLTPWRESKRFVERSPLKGRQRLARNGAQPQPSPPRSTRTGAARLSLTPSRRASRPTLTTTGRLWWSYSRRPLPTFQSQAWWLTPHSLALRLIRLKLFFSRPQIVVPKLKSGRPRKRMQLLRLPGRIRPLLGETRLGSTWDPNTHPFFSCTRT